MLAGVLGALLAPVTVLAGAPHDHTVSQSKLLWSTVNVCDTASHPDTIGIRASMPGSGIRAEEMFMRFQVQYLRPADGRWHNIGPSGDSGFVDVGSGKYRVRQSGRYFLIAHPSLGSSHPLRGVVTFEWRALGEVTRRARKRTTAGHRSTIGSDPPGYSAATCVIG